MRCLSVIMVLLIGAPSLAADWLQFRGSDGRSYSSQTALPVAEKLDDTLAWKMPLPGRAVSGPIVIGSRVVATSSAGPHDDHLHIVCFDTNSGDPLWQRRFAATGRTLHHPTSAVAAPTPASDGRLIFAFFSSNDLICLDLDGNLRWLRALTADYPESYNDTGMASSPCLVGDTIVVQMECQGDSFAAGLDKQTGQTLWRVERPHGANWTSPVSLQMPNGNAVLLESSDRLTALDPKTGETLWEYKAGCSSIPSVTAEEDLIFVPGAGLTALRVHTSKEAKQPEVAWKNNKLASDNASPIAVGDHICTINGAGVLVVGNASDGKIVDQLRLSGTFWATPVVASDHLYAVNDAGLLQVVRLPGKEKAVVVSRLELGEPVYGSPAIGDAALFVRGESHLFKLARK